MTQFKEPLAWFPNKNLEPLVATLTNLVLSLTRPNLLPLVDQLIRETLGT
jgi:hypothetical protein